jgi:hypothetical protein
MLLTALALLAALVFGTVLLTPDPGPAPAVPASRPSGQATPSVWSTRAMPTYKWGKKAAPVVLRLPDRDITLRAWTTCWSGPPNLFRHSSAYCADGAPGLSGTLDDVGSPEAVEFWFGMPGWKFDVGFKQLGTDCPHTWTVPAVTTGRQTFRATPAGPPGRYQVTLEGRGKQGDVFMSFVWTTPSAGPANQPTGYLALITEHDGDLDSYGVELGISHLRDQPVRSSAVVTATAANGESRSVRVDRADDGSGRGCYDAGSLFFTRGDEVGKQFLGLGPAPFTYEVALTLDGTTYTGTATWPRDEKKDEAPNTALTFDPPLPAYVVE